MTCLTVGSAGTWILFSRSDSGLWGAAGRTVPSGRACCGFCFLLPSWGQEHTSSLRPPGSKSQVWFLGG